MNAAILNACSIVRKASLIHDVIADLGLDILIVTESRICDSDPDSIKYDAAPPGYAIHHVPRPNTTHLNRGGGIACIYRENVTVRPRNDLDAPRSAFECQLLEIQSGKNKLFLCNIYRPPSCSLGAFYDELSDLIELLSSAIDNRKLIITGDFNCPGLDGSRVGVDLESLLHSFDLIQHVKQPTRLSNLLDLLITVDGSNLVSDIDVCESGDISDHRIITFKLQFILERIKPQPYSFRQIRKMNLAEFERNINASEIFTSPADTSDGYLDQIESVVCQILDEMAPVQTRRGSQRQKVTGWITPEITEAKRDRRKLERKLKLNKNNIAIRSQYRAACKRTNRMIVDARKNFFSEKLSSAEDPRSKWSTIKKLLHPQDKKLAVQDDKGGTFVHVIAEFFVKKINDLKSNISLKLAGTTPSPLMSDAQYIGDEFNDITAATIDEVKGIIHSMPGKSSPLDIIPTSLLKNCVNTFAPMISRLATLSFNEGSFPKKFKRAQVTPLLKKDNLDPSQPVNYRPISNLSTISKIIEKLFLSRIRAHVESIPGLHTFQSAYRKYHNTETAILKILNDVYRATDNKTPTCLLALDLSAAFDTIDHQTLLDRLRFTFGLDGAALSWICSYLTERTQLVCLNGVNSSIYDCACGVPQGSVLGPLLFTLFVAPVSGVITSFGVSFHQFADDTQLYISVDPGDVRHSLSILDRCSCAVHDWFTHNGLSLNPTKSEILFMGTRQQVDKVSCSEVEVLGCKIVPRDDIKSLGVRLDKNLTFNKHVDETCKSIHYHSRALRHIRGNLNVDTAKTIACAIGSSRLDYCNGIMQGISGTNMIKLQRAQNTLARIVVGCRRNEHITPVLRRLHWLPVKQRITFKIATLVQKVRTTQQPAYLADLLNSYRPERALRSSNQGLLEIPRTRTVIAAKAFSVCAPAIWNNLPQNIRNSDSISGFRRSLKTHLFSP